MIIKTRFLPTKKLKLFFLFYGIIKPFSERMMRTTWCSTITITILQHHLFGRSIIPFNLSFCECDNYNRTELEGGVASLLKTTTWPTFDWSLILPVDTFQVETLEHKWRHSTTKAPLSQPTSKFVFPSLFKYFFLLG